MNRILDRWQSKMLTRAARERRVILPVGPRQCGKTTLVTQLESEQVEYRRLDDGTLEHWPKQNRTGSSSIPNEC